MLTFMPPERVFTVVGLVSCVAFIPAAFIDFDAVPLQRNRAERQSLWRQLANGFRHVASRARLWLAASLETAVFIVTYGLKAFLPLFAIQEAGFEVWVAGLFFTVQEAAHLATRPVGGRLGDRVGYLPTVAGGMATLAAMLLLLPGATTATALLALAVLGGIGQGLIFPSTIAMVGDSVAPGHMGLGMGVYGMFKNLGKVAGPVIAGALLEFFSYATVFTALAWFILATAAGLALAHRYRQRPVEQRL
jgi:MFS family permease